MVIEAMWSFVVTDTLKYMTIVSGVNMNTS